jgi:hypothetical protein
MVKFVSFSAIAFAFLFVVNLGASRFYPGGYLLAQAPVEKSASVVNLGLLALLMLLGIVSSFVFERAKQAGAAAGTVWTNLSAVFSDFRLIAAIFVSPIIFNSVYSMVHQNPESISDFLLAYQNGFFWQSIISGIAGRKA